MGETTTTTLKVTASNGDKLIRVQIMTKAAAQSVSGSDMNLPVAAQSHPASSSLPGLASVIPDVEAGTLAVSFSDCGDASTDVVVKDVVPETIAAGSTTTITGSGSLKKDITGGSYDMRMTGVLSSVLVKNCNGDASKANTCDIVAPLLGKVGTIAYQPVAFPIKAGDISGVPKVAVTLRAGLPASLETTTTTLKVTASNGDKLICVQIMTKAAAQSVSGSMAPALPLVSMPSVPSISMPPAKAIEDIVCKVAEQKWIEDKATGAICSAVTKELPIPNCQSTLEKMWDKIVTMCPRGLAVEAGTLAVSFSDCGDTSTDAVVKDVVPKTITAGSTTTITGSGSLKKDITGGSYDMRMTGVLSSVLVKNCNGDASKANTCDIVAPLLGKVGTIAYQPVAFPIKAGDISGVPKVAVTLKAGLPASLETTTTTLKVTASNGDKLSVCRS